MEAFLFSITMEPLWNHSVKWECSSIGREPVSKTGGWGFDSLRSCQKNIKMINPFKFVQGVKQEAYKVTWPTTKEVLIGASMVFVLATIASLFFLILDQIYKFLLDIILTINF